MNKLSLRMGVNKRLSPEDAEAFSLWAFGVPCCKRMELMEFFQAWHERHGSKLLLSEFGNPHDDLGRMIEIWRADGSPTDS